METDLFALAADPKGTGDGYAVENAGAVGEGSRIPCTAELLAAKPVQQDSSVHALLHGNHEANCRITGRNRIFDASEIIQPKILDTLGVGGFSGADGICV